MAKYVSYDNLARVGLGAFDSTDGVSDYIARIGFRSVSAFLSFYSDK